MEGIRGSTIKKIRAKAMRDLEAICKKVGVSSIERALSITSARLTLNL